MVEGKPPEASQTAFAAFWQAYKCKRRVKRGEAEREWVAQHCEAMADKVMEGLARFKATEQWREGFMPEPARWLKYRRWEDEPEDQDETPAAGW